MPIHPFFFDYKWRKRNFDARELLEEDAHHKLRGQVKQLANGGDFTLLELRMTVCLAAECAHTDFARIADVLGGFVIFKHLREQQILVHYRSSFQKRSGVYATRYSIQNWECQGVKWRKC